LSSIERNPVVESAVGIQGEVSNENLSASNRVRSMGIYHAIGKSRSEHILNAIHNKNSIWRGKSLIGMDAVSAEQMHLALDTAALVKSLHRARHNGLRFNYPSTLALLFEKPSLRTRTSFEAGMAQMSGSVVYLAPADVGLGTRESVADVAGSLSRWVDAIAARVFSHHTVEELDKHATVPVINALSDREHPLQMFADMLTIQEHIGKLSSNIKIAYVGDGNNVLHSLILTCARLGVNLSVACPEGYEPDPWFLEEANRIVTAEKTGSVIEIVTDPVQAVKDASVIYTDVWASMGQEAEAAARRVVFAPYSITTSLLAAARPDAIAMHCLPAHRGEEISAEVMDLHKAVILDQAENRLHTQKALLLLMLGV